jgi:hypothetical protein
MGKAASEPIPFAGSQLGATRHVCAFFRNADEEYRVLLPFIQDGFESGDRAFHIIDPKLRNEHLRRLASAGIDVAVAERNGRLRLHDWNDTYFRHGHFDQHAMLTLIDAELNEGAGQGFRLSRAIAHVAWALEDRRGVQDVVEFEARLNYVLPRYKDSIICVYDLARFGAAIVVDMLRTHPMVIIGGILQENPFYVPPDEFLRDLTERRAVTGR